MSVLVGQKAPGFTSAAVMPNGEITSEFDLHEHLNGKYGVLFFYPLDFTFVCPSELIAFDHRMSDFKERNTEVIGVSIDSQFSHNAWRNTSLDKGGIGAVGYPLVADISHSICQSYGIEHPDARVAFRASFLIDRDGLVRAEHINDLPLGRNIDEMLRLVDGLQFHEEHGDVCPAGWKKGQSGMKPSTEGVANYLENNADKL